MLLFFAVLIAVPLLAQEPSSLPEKSEFVWTWSKRCNGDHKLGVTIRLDGKVLYRGVLPICRGSRDAEDGRVMYHFIGGHSFQGEYHTRSTDSIEGNIWQAGGESDALILGISFDSGKQILLNTVHIAKPEKQASSAIDKGLSITTYPVAGHRSRIVDNWEVTQFWCIWCNSGWAVIDSNWAEMSEAEVPGNKHSRAAFARPQLSRYSQKLSVSSAPSSFDMRRAARSTSSISWCR